MCCSDAPDTSGMNRAAEASADVARDALAWYQARDAEARPMREEAGRVAIDVAQQQLTSSRTNDALGAEYADYNRNTFRPLEQGIVADAENFDTPERRQAEADNAAATVNAQTSNQAAGRARMLAASGVNAGSARSIAALAGSEVAQASAATAAANSARQGVETQGFARRMDAASLGRGLASNQATSAGIALNAGNSAVGNAQAPVNMANQAASTYGQGFNTAISGYGQAGSIFGQQAQIQNSAASSGSAAFGALGQIAGQFAGSSAGSAALVGLSDVDMKTDIEPQDPEQALQEVVSTPVSNFKYDPAKLAAKGIPADAVPAGESTGPMAQDANTTMGEQAAPGGKKINLVTMNGKTMAAIQALDKKVNKLASMISSGQLSVSAAA